jgi:Ribonuclease G/E
MFSSWKKFTATQGKYTILMPGTPETFSVSNTTPQGRDYTAWVTASMDRADPGTTYLVQYIFIPSPIDENRKQKAISDTVQYMLKSRYNHAISSSKFSLNGHPGGEIRFRHQNMTGRMRLFVVDNRIYALIVESNRGTTITEKKMTHFLQSFKLL